MGYPWARTFGRLLQMRGVGGAAIGAQPLERASTTCAVRLCSLLEVVTKANTTKHCLGKRPLSQTQTYGSAGANLRDRCCRYLTHGTLRDEHQEVSSEKYAQAREAAPADAEVLIIMAPPAPRLAPEGQEEDGNICCDTTQAVERHPGPDGPAISAHQASDRGALRASRPKAVQHIMARGQVVGLARSTDLVSERCRQHRAAVA